MHDNSDKDLQSIHAITSAQLLEYEKKKEYDSLLKFAISSFKDESPEKQLLHYEEITEYFVNINPLIREYIFICAQDNTPFDLSEISKNPSILELYIKNEKVNKDITEMKFLVQKDINDAGGYYLYFKKNRDAIKSRYPLGVPAKMKYHERLQDICDGVISANNSLLDHDLDIKSHKDIPPVIIFFNNLMDIIEELTHKLTVGESKISSAPDGNCNFELTFQVHPDMLNDLNAVISGHRASVKNSVLNFNNLNFATELFDMMHKKYDIPDYKSQKNKIISENILVKGNQVIPDKIRDARKYNSSKQHPNKSDIIKLIPDIENFYK